MTTKQRLSILVLVGSSLTSWPARADIPPDDQCFAPDEGKPCDNAVVAGGELVPGICTAKTCTRSTPDGPLSYDCHRCVAKEGGTGGQSAGGASTGGGAGSAGTPSKPKKADDSGCSVSTLDPASGSSRAMLALGLLAAVVFRRSSRRTRG